MNKNTPLWLTAEFLHAANAELVDRFGGLYGPCKENLLHSALDRPQNLFFYEADTDLFHLAAAYGFGIAKNHPFSDGNKRSAFIAMQTFLDINGWELVAAQTEAIVIMVALASDEITEKEVAAWLKKNCIAIKNSPKQNDHHETNLNPTI